MVKCPHHKTITLYAQRRDGAKRSFKPEVRRCESCGTIMPRGIKEQEAKE